MYGRSQWNIERSAFDTPCVDCWLLNLRRVSAQGRRRRGRFRSGSANSLLSLIGAIVFSSGLYE